MYRKKNIQLIIILLGLIALSIFLVNQGNRKTRLSVDESYFSVIDTASIDRIEIQLSSSKNVLQRSGNHWKINDKYYLDASMKTVLLTVLNKVRAQRPVPANRLGEIKEDLSGNGIHVDVYSGSDVIQSYISGGNGVSVSYFMKIDEDPYIVHLPGYDSYVSGIFEVSENDWRDRFIFSTNWLGLKELSLEYPGSTGDNFKIMTSGTHFTIPGISQTDTTAIMEYIELFNYFQVDQFINSGDNVKYDSIFNTTPYALLAVDDTSFDSPMVIRFFIIDKEDNLVPCLIGNQPAIMSAKRVKPILRKKKDFIQKQ